MPIYEFKCAACGLVFEELCNSPDKAQCPSCGSEQTELKISAPAPLKKGAFPFKPGPVHPLAASPNRPGMCGTCNTGNCGQN